MFRWIVYLHHRVPFGSFELDRAVSLADAQRLLREFDSNGGYDHESDASLYPYSEENWEDAKQFEDVGCPFNYPAYILEWGNRGAIRIERA